METTLQQQVALLELSVKATFCNIYVCPARQLLSNTGDPLSQVRTDSEQTPKHTPAANSQYPQNLKLLHKLFASETVLQGICGI